MSRYQEILKDYPNEYGRGEPIEPIDLTEFLAGEKKRQEEAETKLSAILIGERAHQLIARKRLKLVGEIAARHFNLFPYPNLFVPGFGMIKHPPYAMKEMTIDWANELEEIDMGDEPMEESGPRECETCRENVPASCFYDFGSRSCRDCNIDGLRKEEAWT